MPGLRVLRYGRRWLIEEIETKQQQQQQQPIFSLDFAALSCMVCLPPREEEAERGLISRTASGHQA